MSIRDAKSIMNNLPKLDHMVHPVILNQLRVSESFESFPDFRGQVNTS